MPQRKTEKISLAAARRLALSAGAGFHRPQGRGPEAVASIVERLGFVQIDTISVVERAHHHILAARLPGYKTDWLEQTSERVFEYWAHAAAYLPWSDFRHTLPRKERIRARGHDWFRIDAAEAERVLERVRAEGPLMARDFEAPKRTAGWWDWKPAKLALEYLFQSGELMVLPRRGFQKVFDLTERVLPPGTDTRPPSPAEHARWYVDRALDVWGLVARDEIAYQRREHLDHIAAALDDAEDAGDLLRVEVEGLPKTPYWVRPRDFDRVLSLSGADPAKSRAIRVLSPFDPLVIHRKRTKRLFDFDFTIECYLPAPKRTFGYFALPLLQGDRFVGLLDAKADRAANRLVVKAVRYDGPEGKRAGFERALTSALRDFADFNGVGEVVRGVGDDSALDAENVSAGEEEGSASF